MTYRFLYLAFLIIAAAGKLHAQQGTMIINEVCVANIDQFIDPAYNYGGWIELYNPTSSQISLDGLYISDESNIRQLTYAIKSNLEHFGETPSVYAISEFAFNNQLPQLLKKSGILD